MNDSKLNRGAIADMHPGSRKGSKGVKSGVTQVFC